MSNSSFPTLVHDVLVTTPIPALLNANGAVVLERIARGAGATKWYYCEDPQGLEVIESELSPGSAVSFYFDGRIRNALYSPTVQSDVETIIGEEGEAVIGVLGGDKRHIDVDFVTGPDDLAEFASQLDSSKRVFFGAFPARDNDGTGAVTIILPDTDGMVRSHPH